MCACVLVCTSVFVCDFVAVCLCRGVARYFSSGGVVLNVIFHKGVFCTDLFSSHFI